MAAQQNHAGVQRMISAQVAVLASRDRVAVELIDALTIAMRKFANSGHLQYECYWVEEGLYYYIKVDKYRPFVPREPRNIEITREFSVPDERFGEVKGVKDFNEFIEWLANVVSSALNLSRVLFVTDKDGNLVETTLLDTDHAKRHASDLEEARKAEANHLERIAKRDEEEARASILRTAAKRGLSD